MPTENSPARIGPKAADIEEVPPHGDTTFWFELIDEKEAAKYLGLTDRTMQKKRQEGGGPKFISVSSRCVRYRRIDLHRYAESRLRASTSDPGSPVNAD